MDTFSEMIHSKMDKKRQKYKMLIYPIKCNSSWKQTAYVWCLRCGRMVTSGLDRRWGHKRLAFFGMHFRERFNGLSIRPVLIKKRNDAFCWLFQITFFFLYYLRRIISQCWSRYCLFNFMIFRGKKKLENKNTKSKIHTNCKLKFSLKLMLFVFFSIYKHYREISFHKRHEI